ATAFDSDSPAFCEFCPMPQMASTTTSAEMPIAVAISVRFRDDDGAGGALPGLDDMAGAGRLPDPGEPAGTGVGVAIVGASWASIGGVPPDAGDSGTLELRRGTSDGTRVTSVGAPPSGGVLDSTYCWR